MNTKFWAGVALLTALTPVLSGCHSSDPAPQTTPTTTSPEADAAASRGMKLPNAQASPNAAPGTKAAAPK